MLIKVFTNYNSIHILENVRDVVLQSGSYILPEELFVTADDGTLAGIRPIPDTWGPSSKKGWNVPTISSENYIIFDDLRPYKWETDDKTLGGTHQPQVKVIDFYDKDGRAKRLLVAGLAYVCNDEGKTIHKVE